MAAFNLEIRITLHVHEIAMKLQRLYLCFRGSVIQWKQWRCCATKRGETGSGKSKMAASKLEIHLSPHVQKIATKFQRLYLCFRGLCFRGPAIQWEWCQCRTTKRGETGSGKSKMAAFIFKIRSPHLVHKLTTECQRLYPCSRDPATQRDCGIICTRRNRKSGI